jgi:3-methyl-2-oxobutanoate hydroxymethyltransferase
MKNTVTTFRAAKGQEKLTVLTAYDYSVARLVDAAGVNAILVGDSLANVMLGHENTVSVTLQDMVLHCASVARAARQALVICDMPFASYRIGLEDTLRNAVTLMTDGHAHAVKLEGGRDFCPLVDALVKASIPVMGHLGLTPQSIHALGGYKVRGRGAEDAQGILNDARALEEAGAFGIVLECVPTPLAARITKEISIPTIGIGAGPQCDGQVLVWQDMLGLTPDPPKFVKRFAEVGDAMTRAFHAYVDEVRGGTYPAEEHGYAGDAAIADRLR